MKITVNFKNSRGQNKVREFNSKHAMQDWIRTVGDQIEVIMTTIQP